MAQVMHDPRCKNLHVNIHHPQGAVYCDNCEDYVLIDWMRICQCCHKKVVKTRSFLGNIKKLDYAVEANKKILECYIRNPNESDFMPGVIIQFGYRNYLVNIKYLAEYMQMPATRNPDMLRPFLNKIETNAMLLMPGTRVV